MQLTPNHNRLLRLVQDSPGMLYSELKRLMPDMHGARRQKLLGQLRDLGAVEVRETCDWGGKKTRLWPGSGPAPQLPAPVASSPAERIAAELATVRAAVDRLAEAMTELGA